MKGLVGGWGKNTWRLGAEERDAKDEFLNVIKCQALEGLHIIASQNHLSRGLDNGSPLCEKSCLYISLSSKLFMAFLKNSASMILSIPISNTFTFLSPSLAGISSLR